MYTSHTCTTYMHKSMCRNHALCTINLPAPCSTSCMRICMRICTPHVYPSHIYTYKFAEITHICAINQAAHGCSLGIFIHMYTSHIHIYIYTHIYMSTCIHAAIMRALCERSPGTSGYMSEISIHVHLISYIYVPRCLYLVCASFHIWSIYEVYVYIYEYTWHIPRGI